MRRLLAATVLLFAVPAFAGVPTFQQISGATSGLQGIVSAWKTAETTAQGGTLTSWWLWGISGIDYDKDGDLDLILHNHTNGAAGTVPGPQLIRNDGSFTFTNVTVSLLGASRFFPGGDQRPYSWDVNKDTWPDIVFMSEIVGLPSAYLNNGSGTNFAPIAADTMNPLYRIDWPFGSVEDLNADTYLDAKQIYEVYASTPLVRVYKQIWDNAAGKFTETTTTQARPTGLPTAIGNAITAYFADYPKNRFLNVIYFETYDLDGDTDNDMVVSGTGSYDGNNFTYFLENTGGGTFVDRTAAWGLPGDANVTAISDLDGDGELDFILSRGTAAGIYIHHAGGGYDQVADASLVTWLKINSEPYQDKAYIEDFNGDGLKDLVLQHRRLKYYRIYGQSSAGVFQLIYNGDNNGWDSDGIWVADVDGDGQKDIVAGGPGEDVTIFKNTSIAVPPSPSVTVDTASPLTSGTTGTAYSVQLSASGANGAGAPFTFSITSGSLPTDLSLSSGGVISGTPSVAGSYTAAIKACDPTPTCSSSKSFNIVIGSTTFTIDTICMPSATSGVAYDETISVTGGTGSATCTLYSGVMCSGLTLGSNCHVTGTPTVAGEVCIFTAQATDSGVQKKTGELLLEVLAP